MHALLSATEDNPSRTGRFAGIHLARHGETDYNRERRFQGWLPVALNARGREQAHELGRRAAGHGFRQLWCSPLARARETAEAVGREIGLEPREDPRLAETDSGDWTDLTFEQAQALEPELFAAYVRGEPSFRFPGGESLRDQAARVAAALEDLRDAPMPVLAVCHGVVIRLALAHVGQSIGDEPPGATPVGNGEIVALDDLAQGPEPGSPAGSAT